MDRSHPGAVERRRRIGQHGPRAGGDQRQGVDGRLRIGGRRLQEEAELGEQIRHPLAGEEVVVVEQVDEDPVVGELRDVEGDVELRGELGDRERLQGQPRQRDRLGHRQVEHVEHHLEQRRPRRIALLRQAGEQGLEGDVLVGVGPQGDVADALQQLAEGGVPREVGAQHQGVEEEPDQPLGLHHAAAGDRRADQDVVGAAPAVEQDLGGGEEDHEQRGALAAGEGGEALPEGRRQVDRQAPAAVGLDGGARPVDRQLEGRDLAAQPLHPVGDLPLQGAGDRPPLPEGVVRILDRQLGQRRGAPLQEDRVEGRDLVEEDADRPAVGGDVVEHRRAVVDLRLQAQQGGHHHRPARQVEAPVGVLLGDALRLPVARRPGKAGEVDQRHHQGVERQHPLARPPLDDDEGGAQRLVPAQHLVEAGDEDGDRQLPGEPQGERDVVERRSGIEAVEEPEALLGEGERQVVVSRRPARHAVGSGRRRLDDRPSRRLDHPGEDREGRRLEHLPHGEVGAQIGAHPARRPG